MPIHGLQKRALNSPHLDLLIIGASSKPNPRNINNGSDNIIMRIRNLLLHVLLVPDSYGLVLRARDVYAVGEGQDGDGVRVTFEHVLNLAGGCVPDAGGTVPGAGEELFGNSLTQGIDGTFMSLEYHTGVALSIYMHYLHVLRSRIETIVTNTVRKNKKW